MKIERRKVDELKAAEYNPRKDLRPGDAEYEKLKRSIQEFGYVEPVIWNKRTGTVLEIDGQQFARLIMPKLNKEYKRNGIALREV